MDDLMWKMDDDEMAVLESGVSGKVWMKAVLR